jgi:uncharacterized protein
MTMLLIRLSEIPPEGLSADEAFDAKALGLEGEGEFELQPGGRLSCRVTRGSEGLVQVDGRLAARLGLTCGRCLQGFDLGLDLPLELVYLPRNVMGNGDDEDEVGLSDHEMVIAYYDGEQLDLGALVREQLLLSLSMKRLCREDCRGLCASCGANRNLAECGCPAGEPGGALSELGRVLSDATAEEPRGRAKRN